MPFYEYECSACKFYVEALQKVSDEPLRKCPSCKKTTLKRLISAPVFRLKGGGWYETDFKSDSEQKRNIHGREEAEAKADAKADTKTEAKAETKPADAKAAPAEGKGEAASGRKAASGTKRSARAKPASKHRPAKAKPRSSARKATRR
jgi:putative FmdB family regulatory protein